MKTSKFIRSVFSLAMLAGFTASSHALTFNYETHGGAIESDPLQYDAGNNVYTPVTPPLYCDSASGTDTCDHGVGNVQFHPEGSNLLEGPTGAKSFLPGFVSKGLHFEEEASNPEMEFPGICWGTPGNNSPDPTKPPFNGVSGEVFGGFNGSIQVDGDPELFGILVHFNRDINLKYYNVPVGFNSRINWFLELKDMYNNPITHKKFVYDINFYETLNNPSSGNCPRETYGDLFVNFEHEFLNPLNSHTHRFHADGQVDQTVSEGGLGCDDATSFEPVGGDPDWFEYNHHLYRINIHGFYPGDPQTGECDTNPPYPINTLWSEEQEESVGCVLFNITQLEGCGPKFWRFQGVTQPSFQRCMREYGCTCPGFVCCTEPFTKPLYEKWGIDPNTDFDEAFDITNNCTGNMTLMKALNKWYPYGGYIHTVTALLNAMNLDNYYYTVDEVKGFVQDRCADGSLSKQDLKELRDLFRTFNLAKNCPLNRIECNVPQRCHIPYIGLGFGK